MKIYNTLTKRIEEFKPLSDKKINLFVCGPTVYDFFHIGNAKTYTQFDFIARYLRFRGYEVFYLQNITDIDDKIISRAKERGTTWDKLAGQYEQYYFEDMKALHNKAVTKHAKATDYIPQIVAQVKILLGKDIGYKTSDGIYFDISKFATYGKLSGRTQADQNAGVSRIDDSLDKKNKNDFCLWKFSKTDEPFWETELGKGRPGWHIEDTAITETFFGPQYDIHGAAIDLIFPHHEAEIAQMESASGKSPLVQVWMHAAFLNIGAQKMSKSKSNFTSAREAVEKYGYRLLRYFFISANYRTTLDYSEEALGQARGALDRLDEFIDHVDKNLDDLQNKNLIEETRNAIIVKLDNDFDTPGAIAMLFEYIRKQNVEGKTGRNVYGFLLELNEIFDFLSFDRTIDLQKGKEIDRLRSEGNFAASDALRDKYVSSGYTVGTTSNATIVKK